MGFLRRPQNLKKSLSEAFIITSTKPQYDKRLFIDLPIQYMKTTSSEHVVYINWSEYQNKNPSYIYSWSIGHIFYMISSVWAILAVREKKWI